MFVTEADYIVPDYQIANLDSVINAFIEFVDREEKDELRRIMGRVLGNAFIAAVVAQPDPNQLVDKWKSLYVGAEYVNEFDGKHYYWEGMKSAFKPYIYARWEKTQGNFNTGSGAGESKSENSTVVTNARRIVNAFNEYSDKVAGALKNRSCYKVRGGTWSTIDTLFGYLWNSGDVYVDLLAPDYTNIQTYLRERATNPGRMNVFSL